MAPNLDHLKKELSIGFKKDIDLQLRRPDLYQVHTPFYYPDGDMIQLFLREAPGDEIYVEDLGTTLMRLSYDFSMDSKNKQKVFQEILSNYQIEEEEGNLRIKTTADKLFSNVMQLINVIIKVSDISYLKRDLVKSLFYEYFLSFVEKDLKMFSPIIEFYPEFDKEKQYPTPYAFKSRTHDFLCVYPIASDDKAKDVTITIQSYELNKFKPETLAVFEDQQSMGRKPLAHLSNVVGKQFATLQGNEERIKDFIGRHTV